MVLIRLAGSIGMLAKLVEIVTPKPRLFVAAAIAGITAKRFI